MDFEIKKLSSTDTLAAQQLFRFFQEDDKVINPTTASDGYVAGLLSKNSFHVLAAIDKGQVIGGLTAYELDMYKEETIEIFLYEIGVIDSHRRKGVATALISRLKEICRERQIREMYVGALVENTPAINLYDSTGGKLEGVAWFTYSLNT